MEHLFKNEHRRFAVIASSLLGIDNIFVPVAIAVENAFILEPKGRDPAQREFLQIAITATARARFTQTLI